MSQIIDLNIIFNYSLQQVLLDLKYLWDRNIIFYIDQYSDGLFKKIHGIQAYL